MQIKERLQFAWWWVCVVAKLGFATSLVCGLLVAYGMHFSVTSAGPFTLGLYGVVILADFIVQTNCAYFNRFKTERLSKQCEKAGTAPLDIIIAVVGYREDSDAWKKCLQSLQKQDSPPRVIVGVVDGQDGPDQSMAQDFATSFPKETTLVTDLPELLSSLYTETYRAHVTPEEKTWRNRLRRLKRSIANQRTEEEFEAERIAWAAIQAKLEEWDKEHDFNKYKAVCLTQPHGHKRTAMFTAFTLAMLIYKAKDAVFTTDSDTILDPAALRQMSYVLGSDDHIGGVTGDVKIWNKNESWLALMCALRYWFAFNIERACQSYFRCVTCISGPIGLYRISAMRMILGPWILQTFLGRDCTFGDDRHLTNRLLGEGMKTAYTHMAFCESDSPAGFVRWVKQQTRWSKSFFREAFWFPSGFAKQSVWLSVETFKQTLYPFILVSTIFQFLYAPTTLLRPVFWIATMFGIAAIKSTYAWIITGDAVMMLFSFYGLFYFFGLLPSKIFALLTINITAWGTSARSTAERKKRESFTARHWHVCHLLLWFWGIGGGFIVFLHHHIANPLLWSLPVVGPLAVATVVPYWDLVQYDLVYYFNTFKTRIAGPASVPVEASAVEIKEKIAIAADVDLLAGGEAMSEKQKEVVAAPETSLLEPVARSNVDDPFRTPSRQSSVSSLVSMESAHAAAVPFINPFSDAATAAPPASRESAIPFPRPVSRRRSTQSLTRDAMQQADTGHMFSFSLPGDGLPMPVTTPPASPKRRGSASQFLASEAMREIASMPRIDGLVDGLPMPALARRSSADVGTGRRGSLLRKAVSQDWSLLRRPSMESTVVGDSSESRPMSSDSEGTLFSPLVSPTASETGDYLDATSRRPSLGRPYEGWQARRKSSDATLFTPSFGGSWRPSLAGRDSTVTLTDEPAQRPVQRKMSHTRFHQTAFANPFAKYDPNEQDELEIQIVGEKRGPSTYQPAKTEKTLGPLDKVQPKAHSPLKPRSHHVLPMALPKHGVEHNLQTQPWHAASLTEDRA